MNSDPSTARVPVQICNGTDRAHGMTYGTQLSKHFRHTPTHTGARTHKHGHTNTRAHMCARPRTETLKYTCLLIPEKRGVEAGRETSGEQKGEERRHPRRADLLSAKRPFTPASCRSRAGVRVKSERGRLLTLSQRVAGSARNSWYIDTCRV